MERSRPLLPRLGRRCRCDGGTESDQGAGTRTGAPALRAPAGDARPARVRPRPPDAARRDRHRRPPGVRRGRRCSAPIYASDPEPDGPARPPPRGASCPRPPSAPAPSSSLPDASTAKGKTYVATVTTNCGDIELTLDGEKAPQAVASFIELAKQNYWLNAPCHRLTTDASLKVLQCGDPTGTGQGNPGYGFGVENAPKDGKYPRGTLAMARTTDPKKGNGGQFFLVYGDSTLPDPDGYTVFGTVTVRVGYCRQDRCRRGRPRRGQRNRRVPRRTDQHPSGCCHREEGLTVSDDKPTPRPTIPSPAALARLHPRPVAAPAAVAHSESARFGRVDDEGHVFVTVGDEEREVGSYPGATPDEALQYFARKYDELAASADLLEARLANPDVSAKEVADGLSHAQGARRDHRGGRRPRGPAGHRRAGRGRPGGQAGPRGRAPGRGPRRGHRRARGHRRRGRADRRPAGGLHPVEDQRRADARPARPVEAGPALRRQARQGHRVGPVAALQPRPQLLRQGAPGLVRRARDQPGRGPGHQGGARRRGRGAVDEHRLDPHRRVPSSS